MSGILWSNMLFLVGFSLIPFFFRPLTVQTRLHKTFYDRNLKPSLAAFLWIFKLAKEFSTGMGVGSDGSSTRTFTAMDLLGNNSKKLRTWDSERKASFHHLPARLVCVFHVNSRSSPLICRLFVFQVFILDLPVFWLLIPNPWLVPAHIQKFQSSHFLGSTVLTPL